MILLQPQQKKSMPLSDEKSLILELQKGTIPPFGKIFSLFNKHIYNFCGSLHKSSIDAGETFQREQVDVLMQVLILQNHFK